MIPAEPATAAPVKPVAIQSVPTTAPPVKSSPVALQAASSEPPVQVVPANRVSLTLVKPGATRVFVAGSFNEWKPERTPLSCAGDGRWVGNLTLPPGRHEYLFVVDGEWVTDPTAAETVENPFGGKNSLLVVSE